MRYVTLSICFKEDDGALEESDAAFNSDRHSFLLVTCYLVMSTAN